MAYVQVDLGVTAETTYSVADKQLKLNTQADIQPYLDELLKVSPLKKIDFSGNTIGIEASKALADAIKASNSELVEVNFADFFTGRLNTEIPRSLEYLLPALLTCDKLSLVNLCDNAFGLQTIDPIEDYLAKAVSLEHVILSNNGMGPFAGARIGKCLFKMAQAKKGSKTACPKSLKTFICGRNRLENGSISYLAIGLRAHQELEVVKLYQNGIRPQGLKKLINGALSQIKTLQVVDLQDNTLTSSASQVLANSLHLWAATLKELNVNDCLMNPAGSLSVVQALAKTEFPRLETLKLQYNELDAKALALVPSIIQKNLPVLQGLELNGNRFEEDSEIVEAITAIFEERGSGELDDLDDLEELDSEEEEEEEEGSDADEEDDEGDLDQLEKELLGVPEEADASVDDIAAELEKTSI
ncbi:hypothetical protein BABINDRAFT_34053 [Babjeviella inositovora NRRL Y-12698]|uniref:Ran-GTPase activating protein 1 C-terminal domain-containing protein n=1 Tax=Babjeviella inositovora NRRL Y-12698 TaxID=984486 RepID=A0A1E3QUA7_9ASCO|nr:uncharacterized protein BABINDRAFT_34053 [Babjeviella inositovora NRRL Y-12698]ODQ81275.1 hypothetical protein BABINDRAFT_34053 [Babjeviella inositovora NRRL Y-12698]